MLSNGRNIQLTGMKKEMIRSKNSDTYNAEQICVHDLKISSIIIRIQLHEGR